MKKTYTRRDSLKLMGTAVVGSQVVASAQSLAAQTDETRVVGPHSARRAVKTCAASS
jgi:hypothetical protein